jgi:hypothetical protein
VFLGARASGAAAETHTPNPPTAVNCCIWTIIWILLVTSFPMQVERFRSKHRSESYGRLCSKNVQKRTKNVYTLPHIRTYVRTVQPWRSPGNSPEIKGKLIKIDGNAVARIHSCWCLLVSVVQKQKQAAHPTFIAVVAHAVDI